MHLVTAPTQQAGFQLELFSMPIHEELTIESLWGRLPSRAVAFLNKQSPKVQRRAKELINRHFMGCLKADIVPENPERAVWEAVEEAKLEAVNPDAAQWYEEIPQGVFDNFVRKYDQYTPPLRDAA